MLFASLATIAQKGPGGVGNTDGTTSLKLWLNAGAGTSTTTNGAAVSSWNDQSGWGYHVTQATTANQPLYTASSVNGQPAITFDGANDYFSRTSYPLFATNTSPLTVFVVFNPTDVSTQRFLLHNPQSNCSNNLELGYHTGSSSTANWGVHNGCGNAAVSENAATTSYNIMTFKALASGSSPSNVLINKNGTALTVTNNGGGWAAAGNYGTTTNTVYIGGRVDQNNSYHTGTIAEIISFNTALNTAQIKLVENYLNAKYNITVANDKYAQPTATTYIKSVAGIGKETDGTSTTASSDGLSITNSSFLLDNGDYFMLGYDNTATTTTTADLGSGYGTRWMRDWFIDKTDVVGTANGNVTLAFDFSDMGIGGTPTGSYSLMYRSGTTGNYTAVVGTSSISGDQVSFTVDASLLVDGYYTLANVSVLSTDATLSALTTTAGTISPTFAAATTAYTASVANATTSITVTPTRNQANATITVNGTAVSSGSASGAIALSVGINTITVVVTAQDGTTTKTYTITVTRAAAIGNALDFAGAQYVRANNIVIPQPYTIETWFMYKQGFGRICVSDANEMLIDDNDGGQVIRCHVNGSSLISTSNAFQYNTWTHLACVVNGASSKIYVNGVDVTGSGSLGAAGLDASNFDIGVTVPGMANPLTGKIDEFRIWNTARTASQINANMTSTISPSSSGLKLYYTFDQGVAGGTNTGITTAFDATSSGYNGTLNGFALSGNTSNWVTGYVSATASNDATLSALTTAAGTISPTFAAATTAYTASVTNTTTSVTVTPTKTDANATIRVQVNSGGYASVTSGSASSALSLNVGSNTIDVKVTAQDGTTVKTYTITVTRAAVIPTITSLSTSTGTVGSTVTITGTNFNITAANNIVYFGGIKAATPSAASATSLTVTVPAGTNYGPISVTNTALNLSAYSKVFFSATKSPAKTSLTTGEFVASSNFSLGSGTWAMTASEGDFNNDGLLDVAVADYNNTSSTSIKIFPNSSTSGTINFGTAVSLSAYSGTRGLAAADLDGDGKLELISVGTGTAKVSIFPNTTSGATISFGTKIDLTINAGAYYALAADFDGDGKIDIACANNNVVSIFLNTTTAVGSITFASKVDFATASGCIGLGVGDINGDGLPDLVTGNSGNNTNNMSVLRNTTSTPGSVSFAAKVDFAISATTTSSYLNLADFDGDGKLDVAISNGNSRSISLFRNTSSGSSITFDSPSSLTGYFSNIGLGVGDINGDGLPDIAAADGAYWRIYLNTGSSGTISFSSNIDLSTVGGPWDASIADLDGDGRADVFGGNGGTELRAFRYVPSFSTNANLSALTTTAGTTAPTFAAATTAYTASVPNATTTVTVTPTKSDANASIQVRVNSGSYATIASGSASSALSLNVGSNTIDVLVTAQDGTTVKTYTITVTRLATPPVVVSFSPITGNIGTTVAITGTGFNTTAANNTVFFGATKATVSAATATSLTVTVPSGATHAAITVLNTGTNLLGMSAAYFVPTFTAVKAGFSASDFSTPASYSTGTSTNPVSVAIGDLNGDGKPEVVVSNQTTGNVSVFPNTSTSGTISFGTRVDFSTGSNAYHVNLGDIDGDGKPDMVVANYGASTVSVFRNTSSGSISFDTKVDLTGISNAVDAMIGDIDGDGRVDITAISNGGTYIKIFLNTTTAPGSIAFNSGTSFTTGSNPYGGSIGDMDGDGKLDVVVSNALGSVSIFRNTSSSGSVSFATRVDAAAIGDVGAALGDVDGDGKLDISTCYTSLYVLRNTSTSGTASVATASSYTGNTGYVAAFADLDGDGKIDALTSYISAWRNTSSSGSLSFASSVNISALSGPYGVAVGDLDGDGKPDIVGVNNSGSTISVIRNNPQVSSNANLSALSISSGTIAPTFATATTAYTATVTNPTTSVTVTPTVADATATIQVRVNSGSYATVTSGSASSALSLNIGSNTIDVKVTAQDGTTIKTYTITVTRLSGNVLDNTGLTATSIPASAYSLRKLSSTYTGNVITVRRSSDNATQNIGFTAGGDLDTTALKTFVASGNGFVTAWFDQSGNARDLAQATTSMQPAIVSSGTIYRKNGKPTIFHDATDDGLGFGGSVYLTSLPISVNLVAGSNGNNNAFRRAIQGNSGNNWLIGPYNNQHAWYANNFNHQIPIPWSTTSVEYMTVIEPSSNPCTSWRNGVSQTTGNAKGTPGMLVTGYAGGSPEYLNGFISEIISFNSELGTIDRQTLETSQSTYYPVPSSNANLSSLTLSTGTLAPTFASGTIAYTASVTNATSSVIVTPTVTDVTATVQVRVNSGSYSSVTSGSASSALALNAGSNTIDVLVSAEDGSTSKIYTITVTRAQSSNADLSALALSSGTLSPTFAAATTSYTASVTNATTSITVTPTKSDANASITVNGSAVTSGSASGSIALTVGANTITVVVTAQDASTKTYTLTVTRAQSSNADLSALTLSSGTLSPTFAAATTSYTASVTNATTSITVTPTKSDANASITVNGSAVTSGSASGSIALTVGTNTITLIVTAQDGTTTKTYTLIVIRVAIPTITSFTPTSGAVGATVTITGTNFNTTAASNIVFFGATKATVSAATATSLTVTVPAGATYAPVTVLNTGSGLLAASTGRFNPTFTPNKNTFVAGDFGGSQITIGSTNQQLYCIRAGDIDGDGKVDLVQALQPGNINVLRNTTSGGTISFSLSSNFAGNYGTVDLQLADLNGDGKLDVVAGCANGGPAVYYINTSTSGTISFNTAVNLGSNSGSRGVALADLDADGRVDILLNNSNTIEIWRNTTTSTSSVGFTLDYTIPNSSVNSIGYFKVADIDGDGKLDIVEGDQSMNVNVFLNQHNASTFSASSFAKTAFGNGSNSEGQTYDLRLADFDNDGKLDIATLSQASGHIHVLRNTSTSGTPGFATFQSFVANAGNQPLDFEIGDLTGDGKIDLITFNYNAGNISVLANSSSSGTVNFKTAVIFTPTANVAWRGRLADLDGDGKLDIAFANVNTPGTMYAYKYSPVISTDANLSALTLSSGTLSPTFAAATTSYTASVTNATSSITVTATKSDVNASITINGTPVTSGSASGSIALSVGTNTITVVVTAEDASTKTYTVTVTRAAVSTDANLSALTISSGTLSPTFATATTSYTASVTNATTSITVTPTKSDANASITVNGTPVTSGSASGSIALTVGTNTITVVVTAQDASIKTYTLTVTRAQSSNADLSSLVLSAGTLSPIFGAATTSYTSSVAFGTTNITVTPTKADANASIKVNTVTVASGSASGSIALSVGTNTITVVVTAHDASTKTYTVTVIRAAAATDASLSALTISSGTLTPTFAAATTSYTATVSNATSSITVTPTKSDVNASITVNGTPVTSGSASGAIALSVGSNTVTVVVTAQDASTKTYTITISRTAAIASNTISSAQDICSGTAAATLTGSTPTGGNGVYTYAWLSSTTNSTTGFAVAAGVSNDINYSPGAITQTTWYKRSVVSGTETNESSVIAITVGVPATVSAGSNQTVCSNVASVALSGTFGGSATSATWSTSGTGTFNTGSLSNIVVPSLGACCCVDGVYTPNGTFNGAPTWVKNQYYIKWTGTKWVVSEDGFYPDGYITNTGGSTTNLPASGWAYHSVCSSGTTSITGGTGNLATGTTYIPSPADISAGSVSLTYTTNDPTGACPAAQSSMLLTLNNCSDANLTVLTISSGTLAPTFASATTAYTASVANATTSVTVTPTKSSANATIQARVNGGSYASVISGSASSALSLNVGSNTIDVKVTAQDGTTIKTYTITVTRAQSSNADLSALILSSGTLAPTFAAATTSYTASVTNATASITVTPTKADANASITVNGTPVNSGSTSGFIALTIGTNTITIVVTAQDGTTTKTYTVTVTRAGTPTWAGTTSIDWNTASNWTPAAVPTTTDPVTIPAGTPFAPNNAGAVTVASLTVASGVSVTNTGTINVTGALSNNGTISGTVALTGSSAQAIAGTGTIANLTLNNSAGATITSGAGNTVTITGTYTPTAGTLITNSNLVLASTATGTARIAAGTGTYISGAVTQQRYIPAKAARTYSLVASPFTQSISSAWQQQVHITGAGTGGTICPTLTPNSNGFDATITNAASMFVYDGTKAVGSRWTSVTGTTGVNLTAGTGYRMNIRGPRSIGCSLLDGTVNTVAAATLSSTGTLSNASKNMGSFTLSYSNNGNTTVANDNYLLIGNPYPSEISFSQLRSDNSTKINNNYAIYAPGNSVGNYAYWSGSTWTGGSTGLSDATGNVIANGQAFFVQSSTAGASISNLAFNEAQKTTTANNGYFRTMLNPNRLRIGYLLPNSSRADEIMVQFTNNGTIDKLNNEDIVSINSGTQNLKSVKGESMLAINTRPLSFISDTVRLSVASNANGMYKLGFYDFDEMVQASNVKIYLIDNLAGTTQLMNDVKEYSFTVNTADAASYGAGRFAVVFTKPVVPVIPMAVNIKAYPNPVTSQLNVQLPANANYTIRLSDIRGKLIMEQQASLSTTINMARFASGTYMLEVINEKGEKTIQKIIKN